MPPIYKNKDLYAGQALQNTLFNQIGMTQGSWNTSKKSTGGHELSRESNKKKGGEQCSRRKLGSSWGGGWLSEHGLAEEQLYFKISSHWYEPMCAEDEGGMTECLCATGALSPNSICWIPFQEGQAHTEFYMSDS